MNIEQARFNMIEQQIRPWNVLDQDVLDLLSSPAVHDDPSLLELANTLAALEKEVRRT